ncbi:MAG: ATP-binding cassette domain-containing protein [Candidatus Dadabacteria bacterium]|nr:ATP-binding cassette domain-containing protein [Candidatus Dadabacteria bacterium]NIQ13774.1 ATP-binding cassette domain-containing protein [Candidatus Dadabacteria bacterium]
MHNNAVVEFENVQIGYDKRPILERVLDLTILREQFWGIVGPNGGGKTTFLKTIIGLLPPVSGHVHYEYSPVFGYVPQFSTFDDIYPFSVKEFVSMGRYSRIPIGAGIGKKDKEKIMQCIEMVDISHIMNRPFRSLSGGEKQRALLARSLAGYPDILILDEPTASVDWKGESEIMSLINKIRKDSKFTVLMVSHYLDTIKKYSENVILIDKDKNIFQHGTNDQLINSANLSNLFGIDIKVENTDNRFNSIV